MVVGNMMSLVARSIGSVSLDYASMIFSENRFPLFGIILEAGIRAVERLIGVVAILRPGQAQREPMIAIPAFRMVEIARLPTTVGSMRRAANSLL